jgi:hypothetical protein
LKGAEKDYLLIVTTKELGAGSGADLESMYPEGTLEYPSEVRRSFLPLSNTYVVSVDDYERLLVAARDNLLPEGSSISGLLRLCIESDQDPAVAKVLF